MKRMATTMGSLRTSLTTLLVFLGFLVTLTILPYWMPVDPDIASAAGTVGYNTHAAYILSLGWSGIVILGVSLAHRSGYFSPEPSPQTVPAAPAVPWRSKEFWFSVGVVALGVTLVYFPPFLSWSGPFVEDGFFLSNLHRMAVGQRPYVDFEFLYGPLMIYPAGMWHSVFGFSLMSYYSYLVVLEIIAYTLIIAIIFPAGENRWLRWVVFLIVASLILNVLLGPNQNGLRKLIPVVAMLLVALRPNSLRHVLAASILIGAQLAYSHEYAIAALIAVAGMYGYLALVERRLQPAIRGALLLGGSVVVWAALSVVLLGSAFDDYVVQTLYLADRFNRGQSSFEFYWTVNSLAAFFLLSMSLVVLGQGVTRGIGTKQVAWTDLFFLGAVIYALVALKSGLNRSDLWHLVPPFIPLVLAFLLPWTTRALAYSPRVRTLARVLIGVMAITYTVGQAPMGSFWAEGLFLGAQGRLSGSTAALPQPVTTPAPVLRLNGPNPDLSLLPIIKRLNQLRPKGATVLFYSDTWGLDKLIGFPKTYFSNDDFLHSEERGLELQSMLQERPETVVLIRRPVYDRLYGLDDGTPLSDHLGKYNPTLTKQIAAVLSTVHYRGLAAEASVKEDRWTRTVGRYVRDHYTWDSEVHGIVVLTRKKEAP